MYKRKGMTNGRENGIESEGEREKRVCERERRKEIKGIKEK